MIKKRYIILIILAILVSAGIYTYLKLFRPIPIFDDASNSFIVAVEYDPEMKLGTKQILDEYDSESLLAYLSTCQMTRTTKSYTGGTLGGEFILRIFAYETYDSDASVQKTISIGGIIGGETGLPNKVYVQETGKDKTIVYKIENGEEVFAAVMEMLGLESASE